MTLGILEQIVLGTIRGLLNGHIGKFTEEQLQAAIDNDMNLWGETNTDIKRQIGYWKRRFSSYFKKYIEKIDTPLLVEWLRIDQPHLNAIILKAPKNYNWFDRQVATFLDEIKKV